MSIWCPFNYSRSSVYLDLTVSMITLWDYLATQRYLTNQKQSMTLWDCLIKQQPNIWQPYDPGAGGGGGILDLSLDREVPPGPWNPDAVYDKKKSSWESWRLDTLFMIFRSNSTHFFLQNAWFLDPVYKRSSKIFEFETLFMSGRSKNHTLKGGTSPYSLCMGVSLPSRAYDTL